MGGYVLETQRSREAGGRLCNVLGIERSGEAGERLCTGDRERWRGW